MTARVRVVLAEDSYLVREGVRRLLETDPDIELTSCCVDLEGLLAAVERDRPDVVVTDIRMPPRNTDEGIQAAARLRDEHPEIGVVVLSQHDEPEYALRLLERGSARRAYLLKDSLTDPASRRASLPWAVLGLIGVLVIVETWLALRRPAGAVPYGFGFAVFQVT